MTFHSNLPHIAADLAQALDGAARESANQIRDRAKQRVPVGTGRLRDSIHVDRIGISDYSVMAGDQHVFYGHVVEHGDTNTPPRPFLVPALEESRQDAVNRMILALRSLL